MKQDHARLKPEVTVAVLAYELNSVALTVAAEAEMLVRGDQIASRDAYYGCVEMAATMNDLIGQLREAAQILRCVRHTGEMPARRSSYS
jgi:hypothetical protein